MQLGDVGVGIRSVADDDQRQIGRDATIGLDHDVRVVLGLEPTDVEDVAPWLQPEPDRGSRRRARAQRRAVREQVRRAAVGAEVVVLDHGGVGDHVDGQSGGDPCADSVVGLADPIPLGPLPLESIDVEDDVPVGQAKDDDRRDVRRVADIDDVVPVKRRVDRREQAVDDRLEVLRARRGQSDDVHAAE